MHQLCGWSFGKKMNRVKSYMMLMLILTFSIPLTYCGCRPANDAGAIEIPDDEEKVEIEIPTVAASRKAMTDPYSWMSHSELRIRNRFSVYKELGADVVRAEFNWGLIEKSEGNWNTNDPFFTYCRIAKEKGFRIKLILGHMSDVPRWFYDVHPEAYLVSEDGDKANNAVSYWYDGIEDLVREKTNMMIRLLEETDVYDVVDFIEPSLGVAGEPIYPPQWTQPSLDRQKYWCYSDAARADFQAAMREKYSTIEALNNAWGTSYALWSAIDVLKPGELSGKYWEDVLTWYRDAKRTRVRAILDITREAFKGSGKRILINVPGVQYTESQWTSAITGAAGGISNIKTMEDTDYLLDYAAKYGLMVEYTGLTPGWENVREIRRIVGYLSKKKNKVDVWAENVGDSGTASRIPELQKLVTDNRLYGFDYTHGNYLFSSDGVTPDPDRKTQLTALFTAIDQLYAEK